MAAIRSMSALAVLAALCFNVSIAHAQAGASHRVWVSGHGSDAAGCGATTAPCRSFQYVIDNVVAPSGEIDVLDPAGYGAVTISHAVSIVNDGVGTAGVQQPTTGLNAIVISAGANDSVVLRGLNIDGLGVAQIGIWLKSGASLTIDNCVVHDFTNKGGYFNPGSGVFTIAVSNSAASNNSQEGFIFWPSGTATLTGVVTGSRAENNGNGGFVVINTGSSTSTVSITGSLAFNNTTAGFQSVLSGAKLILSSSTSMGNSTFGVQINGGATADTYGNNNLQGNVSGAFSGSAAHVLTQ